MIKNDIVGKKFRILIILVQETFTEYFCEKILFDNRVNLKMIQLTSA